MFTPQLASRGRAEEQDSDRAHSPNAFTFSAVILLMQRHRCNVSIAYFIEPVCRATQSCNSHLCSILRHPGAIFAIFMNSPLVPVHVLAPGPHQGSLM